MPAKFLTIEMLPALHGDCLWVEYGTETKKRRILIDGGPIGAFESLDAKFPAGKQMELELLVLTHVDTDHVDGLVRLFAEKPLRFSPKQVWFNGWRHLVQRDNVLGGLQGEYFSALLDRKLLNGVWNGATNGDAIVIEDAGLLPVFKLTGGMKITLLSPTRDKLEVLQKDWAKHIAKKDIDPGDLDAALEVLAKDKRYLPDGKLVLGAGNVSTLAEVITKQDGAKANGSSIAFLAEYGPLRCLFLGDAHPDVVTSSIKRLLEDSGDEVLSVDAVKIAHHGSKGNTTSALLELIDAKYFLISSNGAQFDHPDPEAIARIVKFAPKRRPTLCFNYQTKFNKKWFDKQLQKVERFKVQSPTATGHRLKLTA